MTPSLTLPLEGEDGWEVRSEGDSMLEKMKGLVKGNDLCVLATVSEGKPHCSLMSYISDEEGHEIYLVSHKKTKKYSNLIENPTASLLIDTREEEKGQRRIYIKALTVNGEFQTINDPVKKVPIPVIPDSHSC